MPTGRLAAGVHSVGRSAAISAPSAGPVRHAGALSRYAAAKPYVLPESLAELDGPTTGGITLPRHIDWGPHYVYDLADEADFRLMYERVIREAQTRDDLNAYLHAVSLRRVWQDLFLPLPVRAAWEARFPELRESSTTAAAAQWTNCTAS